MLNFNPIYTGRNNYTSRNLLFSSAKPSEKRVDTPDLSRRTVLKGLGALWLASNLPACSTCNDDRPPQEIIEASNQDPKVRRIQGFVDKDDLKILNVRQGRNSDGYKGDCGLVSTENLLILFGKLPQSKNSCESIDPGEQAVVDYAKTHFKCLYNPKIAHGYCNSPLVGTSGSSWEQGISNTDDIVAILKNWNVCSTSKNSNFEEIAQLVSSKKGVIANVDSHRFRTGDYSKDFVLDHAINIRAVKYNDDNEPEGFYTTDSGIDEAWKYVPREQFEYSTNLRGAKPKDYAFMIGLIVVTDETVDGKQDVNTIHQPLNSGLQQKIPLNTVSYEKNPDGSEDRVVYDPSGKVLRRESAESADCRQ